jgi:uncharacterized protein (DUF433 family)
MKLPDFLRQTTEGEILLAGHRIGLFHVVHAYNQGHSPEMLASHYPTLSLALIRDVIAFYLANQADVDAYVADCEAKLQSQRQANPKRLDPEKLRKRLHPGQATKADKPPAEV